MPASIQIQGAVPYGGNYQSFQSRLVQAPQEGNLTIPVSIGWTSDTAAPNYSMAFQLQGQRNLQITQICALYVDNLSNDADVVFYFPDTQFRLDIPAYTVGVFPVITNGLQFVAQCANAIAGAATFIQILNFNPPPVAVEKTVFQSSTNSGSIALTTGTSNHNFIIGTGSLHGFVIAISGATASALDNLAFELTDDTGSGLGSALFGGQVSVNTTAENFQVVSPGGLNIQFHNGVTLHLVDSGGLITGGNVTVNLYTSP